MARTSTTRNMRPTRTRVAIVVSRYNATITDALLQGAIGAFLRSGGTEPDVTVIDAPGAFEVPVLCAAAARSKRFDAIVALACIVRGSTRHDRVLGHAVTQELSRIAAESLIPVGLGVLTVETIEQAQARAGGEKGNKGAEAMEAVLLTLDALRSLRGRKPAARPGVTRARPDKARSAAPVAGRRHERTS